VRKSVKFAVVLTLLYAVAWAAQHRPIGLHRHATIGKFEEEGLQHSHVMEVMSYLSMCTVRA